MSIEKPRSKSSPAKIRGTSTTSSGNDRSLPPKEVRVRITIRSISEIDIVKQQFTANIFLEASWIDSTLKKKIVCNLDSVTNKQVRLCNLSLQNEGGFLYIFNGKVKSEPSKSYFHPRLVFKNLVKFHDNSKEEWYKVFDQEPDNTEVAPIVCYRLTGKASFEHSMELHMFPFDLQNLTIQLTSQYENVSSSKDTESLTDEISDERTRVKLVQNLSKKYVSLVNQEHFILQNEYKLYPDVTFKETETKPIESASRRKYPILSMSVSVRRKAFYFLFNMGLPMFLITSISLCFLAMSPGEVAGRVFVPVTTLLTTIAFKFSINGLLPNISYLSVFDYYMFLCLILQAAEVGIIASDGILADSTLSEEGIYDFHTKPSDNLLYATLAWLGLHVVGIIAIIVVTLHISKRTNHLWILGLSAEATRETFISDYKKAYKHISKLKSCSDPTEEAILKHFGSDDDSKLIGKIFKYIYSGYAYITKCINKSSANKFNPNDFQILRWSNDDAKLVSDKLELDDQKAYSSKDSKPFVVVTFTDDSSIESFMNVVNEYLKSEKSTSALKSFEKVKEDELSKVSVENLKSDWHFLAKTRVYEEMRNPKKLQNSSNASQTSKTSSTMSLSQQSVSSSEQLPFAHL